MFNRTNAGLGQRPLAVAIPAAHVPEIERAPVAESAANVPETERVPVAEFAANVPETERAPVEEPAVDAPEIERAEFARSRFGDGYSSEPDTPTFFDTPEIERPGIEPLDSNEARNRFFVDPVSGLNIVAED